MKLEIKHLMGEDNPNGAEVSSHCTMDGSTLQADLGDEDYVILRKKDGKWSRTVDVSFRNSIIRIYDDKKWRVHPMSRESKTVSIEVVDRS